MPPVAICNRRRRLYENERTFTAQFLKGFCTQGGFTPQDAPRLEAVLKRDRRKALVVALETVLEPYVVYGVCADLARLRPSRALFVDDQQGTVHPDLATVLPTGGESPQEPLKTFRFDDNVLSTVAYTRYFDWYIDPDNVGDGKSGVTAFYERYPLLKYAVKTVASHYRDNIQLACERVLRDWADIQTVFFPGGKLKTLSRIRTTGSDFHKGGKQVLILSFELDDRKKRRVVYKPSSVEIDCRLVGDSRIFGAAAPGGRPVAPKGDLDAVGYTQNQSLTELVNALNPPHPMPDGVATRPLPTYPILPYNRGSVPDAYGYVKFLSHVPDVEVSATSQTMTTAVGAEIANLDARTLRRSDWIAAAPSEARQFYHQFGALMAMALAVSLCDLHLQNLIVHKREPCLIDLEEALKTPMTEVSETYLVAQNSSPLGRFHDPGSFVLWVANDLTSDLKLEGWKSAGVGPADCALYLSDGTPAAIEGNDPQAQPRRLALIQGFIEVTEAIGSPMGNAQVKQWVQGLQGTIARYVVRSTSEYATNCRSLYERYKESTIRPGAPVGAYDTVSTPNPGGTLGYFFRRAVEDTRSTWRSRWTSHPPDPATPWKWRAVPLFAVEHPDHAWRDYLNCDVPSFYHRLNTADLVSSSDLRVDVGTVTRWQNSYITDPGEIPAGWQGNANGSYFRETPIAMVSAQLDRLAAVCAGDPATKAAYLIAALKGTGLDADLTQLLQAQAQPVGAGAQH